MTDYEIYQSSFIYLLYRIPSNLRCLSMMINRNPNKIMLVAYFENQPSESEIELIGDIGDDIFGMTDEVFKIEVAIKHANAPLEMLQKSNLLLYARYERAG